MSNELKFWNSCFSAHGKRILHFNPRPSRQHHVLAYDSVRHTYVSKMQGSKQMDEGDEAYIIQSDIKYRHKIFIDICFQNRRWRNNECRKWRSQRRRRGRWRRKEEEEKKGQAKNSMEETLRMYLIYQSIPTVGIDSQLTCKNLVKCPELELAGTLRWSGEVMLSQE